MFTVTFNFPVKVYNLDTKFDFGKYRGWAVKEVIYEDPGYVEWCLKNIKHFTISNNARTILINLRSYEFNWQYAWDFSDWLDEEEYFND
jgi:hypothetical protein